jgi:hypothetical protein
MSIAGVVMKEIDLTTRVPSFEGVYVAACFQTKRGDIDPFLVTSEAQFLRKTTLNETIEVGFDLGYYSVLAALQKTNKVWIKRVLGTGYLYGGVGVEVAGAVTDNVVIAAGEADPTAFIFIAEAFLLYAKDPGDWSDDIGFKLWVYRTNETIDVSEDIDYATNTLTVTQKWVDCEPVRLIVDSDGTFPTGLAKDTTYYTIKDTTTTVRLATSVANAIAGTAIDIVDINEITNGTATSTVLNSLMDSSGSFIIDGIVAGDVVENTTDDTFSTVVSVTDLHTLVLNNNIMVSGDDYIIYDMGGVTTSTIASKLVDSAADFVTDEIAVGDIVLNLTDSTTTTVSAIDSLTTLSVADDIMVSGDIYRIQKQNLITTGTTTSTVASNLVDSTADFVTDGILAGDVVENTMDDTFAVVTTVTDLHTLILDTDIMVSGDDYIIYDMGGVTTSTIASKLVDSAADFVTDEIAVGDIVLNLTDSTSTTVTAIDSLTTLSVADDYFISGDIYRIQKQNLITEGTTTSTVISSLVDSTADFVTDGILAGDVVENTMDDTFAVVTTVTNLTTLVLDDNLMTLGEGYIIYDMGGVTTSIIANKLVDTAADFVTDEIAVGDIVLNLTDSTSALVTVIDSLTTLTLDTDIMVSGDIYRIQKQGTITMIPLKEVKESGAFIIEVFKSTNENVPVETFTCSRVEGTKDGYGQNIYIEDRLQASEYIRALDNILVTNTVIPQAQATILYLDKGADGATVTDTQMIAAADAFSNKLDKSVTVFIDSGWATTAYQNAIANICADRQDSVAILSTTYASEISSSYLNDIVDYRNNTLNLGGSVGSYAALYSPHVKIRDKYNNRELYVSPDGYAAAAISYTAYNYEMWYPVSGFKRGILFNVIDLSRRFDEGELTYLYDNEVNPYRFYPGKGIMIWGQKTLYGIPSILDRLNTRLLLIILKPSIAEALETFVWDLNSVSTRAIAKNRVDNYMEGIKALEGVTDFYTVCDDTNNFATDIENHIMNLDLFIKPTPSLEYINFTTILTPEGMSFELAQTAV